MYVVGLALRESAPGLALLLRVTSARAMVAAGYLRAGRDEFGRPRRSLQLNDSSTGAGSAGNPFASSTDANARRIVAYGLRNPFRINFRPGTPELWAGDVGWNEWEEINTLNDASDAVAENFGWPCYEGTLRQPGYDNQNLPICETLYGQSNAVTAPFYRYRHSDQVIPGESCPIGGSAIAGLSFAFYGGGPYPAEYDGALFFADYTRRCIWAMERGGTTKPSPSNIKGFVGGAASPVELQIGPDGNLYYVDIGGGTIRRITYTAGANQPPVAVATANPTSGDIGMTVNFDGSGSSDPNGDPLSYEWDLDGDGALDDSTAVRPSWTYNTAGNYRVSLRVSDGRGGMATDAITIGVGRPNVTISTTMPDPRGWAVGETVGFSGSATDNQGAPIPASNLTWSLVLKHGANPPHVHFVQGFPGVACPPEIPGEACGSFQAPDHDYPSELELSLTATDSSGLAGTASVQLQPRTTMLTFATNPTGLTLTFNGANATAPFDRTVIVNSTNSVSAPSPQNLRGSGKQVFKSWSDGVRTPTRTIVAPPSGGAYTANFAKR
jgi:PKD repeat protein